MIVNPFCITESDFDCMNNMNNANICLNRDIGIADDCVFEIKFLLSTPSCFFDVKSDLNCLEAFSCLVNNSCLPRAEVIQKINDIVSKSV